MTEEGWTTTKKRLYRESYAKGESSLEAARLLLLKAARDIKEGDFDNGCSQEFCMELRSLAILTKRLRHAMFVHRHGMFNKHI